MVYTHKHPALFITHQKFHRFFHVLVFVFLIVRIATAVQVRMSEAQSLGSEKDLTRGITAHLLSEYASEIFPAVLLGSLHGSLRQKAIEIIGSQS